MLAARPRILPLLFASAVFLSAHLFAAPPGGPIAPSGGRGSAADAESTITRDSAGPGDTHADTSFVPPKVIHSVPLQLTDEARAAKFSGSVLVSLTVDTDGNPQNIHVVQSVGLGLDENAVAAAKQFRFQPATRNGTPVAAGMNLELRIRDYEKITVVHSAPLELTDEARQAHLSGAIRLSFTIDENGDPHDVRVVQGVGMGMDERAVEAIQQYKFEPFQKDGKPAPRAVTIQLTFDASE